MNWARLVDVDQRWSEHLRAWAARPGVARAAASVLAHSGDSPLWIAGLALLWGAGSGALRQWAQLAFLGVIATAGVVMLVKVAVRRQRPAGDWGQSYRKIDPHSFPSGHAARAFMLASLAMAWGPMPGILLFLWAGLVAAARVAMGVHYWSDVVVGAGVGLLSGACLAPWR